jgi:hypothetical protein
MHSSDSAYGPMTDFCQHGNEPSGSLKRGEFLEYLSHYQLLNEDCANKVI